MFVRSLPTKSKSMLARDIFETTHFVHDVTNTDCLVQSKSTRGCVLATFKPRFSTNMFMHRAKNFCKSLLLVHSCWQGLQRLFALIPLLGFVVDPCVYIYLNYYLEKCQLLYPFQSGSRRKYSCSTALACLTNSWLTAMNKSEMSGVVFLDLKKAFYLVDHDILLKKLAIYLKNSCSLTS